MARTPLLEAFPRPAKERQVVDPRVRLALEIMRQELGGTLRVAEVARRVALSPSRLEHLIRAERGRSFSAELRHTRLAEAKTLLRDDTLWVKEVAAQCGYASMPSFSRAFKEKFGSPPSGRRRS